MLENELRGSGKVEYHEPIENLSQEAVEYHRVIQSVKEELEAIGWYNQRADATDDQTVKSIMEHNRDEEIEHAVMGIEWLRRNYPVWEEMLRTFLFTETPIADHQEENSADELSSDQSLGINNLK